jgi:uncharacterized circularly permuted ATP-grasp superfamily protein
VQAVIPPGYDLDRTFDEAFAPDGRPRPGYGPLIEALSDVPLDSLAAAVRGELAQRGVTFGDRHTTFPVDPVPRILGPDDWHVLEQGLAQRVRALQAFVADAYGERRMVAAGRIPREAIETADHFEPWMLDVPMEPWAYAPVAGPDVVRDSDGALRVLEDNLRTPSGVAYVWAVRAAADTHLPLEPPAGRQTAHKAIERLGRTLQAAAPGGEGYAVLLSDGPANSAWYEHRDLSARLGIPLVLPGDVHLRGGRLHAVVDGVSRTVDVVYRRTDEDRLREPVSGKPTWLADLLLEPCRRGRLACVNGLGSGVADDKLVHAYVEEMVRFFLGEEPLIESVPTYDLTDPTCRKEALERLDELVIKPRAGHGGHGLVVGPHAEAEDVKAAAGRIEEEPLAWVAQETVSISRHPTVEGQELVPRHVDLRCFVVSRGDDAWVLPGGLTRVAFDRGALVVNSSQNGGGKDTWVVSEA